MVAIRAALDYRPALLTHTGIGRAVRGLASALGRHGGIDLRLFGHSFARAAAEVRVPRGCRLHRVPIPGRALGLCARVGLDAGRLAGRPALFHWTDYIHPPVRRATPTVLTIHDLAFAADPSYHGPEQSDRLLERTREAAGRAGRVIVPTAATAAMLREHLGLGYERIAVIPFGCDHVPRSAPGRLPPPPGGPYLLAIGTIEPRKNHRLLLRAWRQLRRPRPRLVIIGRRGWECGPIVAELAAAAQHDDCLWLERATDAEVFHWLEHAAALVYPSRHEGFGFPPLEALALGTPVIAGDTPALRETLGDAASFCDLDDAEDLAQRMAALPPRRAPIVRFAWDDCAAAHASVYEKVATEGRP